MQRLRSEVRCMEKAGLVPKQMRTPIQGKGEMGGAGICQGVKGRSNARKRVGLSADGENPGEDLGSAEEDAHVVPKSVHPTEQPL